MSTLASRLDQSTVVCRCEASSRKRVLETIATTVVASPTGAPSPEGLALFDGLLARERLGSTAIGEGVAIPHCRHDVTDIRVCLLTTKNSIDYEASDGEAVDIFFALIVPHDEHTAHLRALADLSTILADSDNRARLRACDSETRLLQEMQTLLAETEAP